MSGYVINWSSEAIATLWGAGATFGTGALAVIAAFAVGRAQVKIADRQVDISRRQTEILHRQTELEEVKLRADIFDRRFKVYEAAADVIVSSIISEFPKVDTELQRQFRVATNQAQFLFRPGIAEALQEIDVKLNDLSLVRSSIVASETTDVEFDGAVLAHQRGELIHWLAGRVNSLPALFGDELRLTTARGDQ